MDLEFGEFFWERKICLSVELFTTVLYILDTLLREKYTSHSQINMVKYLFFSYAGLKISWDACVERDWYLCVYVETHIRLIFPNVLKYWETKKKKSLIFHLGRMKN